MSGIYGLNIKLSIFGESHGKSIGAIIDGMPPGLNLDLCAIEKEMSRRAPGNNTLSTARKESDLFEIQSGFFNGHTTGTPLCVVIKNNNQHSGDYSVLADKMRPGHADYAGNIHYHGFNDYRGGGHFSGRLTAPLVFVGAIAKQALKDRGIFIGSHVLSISDISEKKFDAIGIADDDLLMLTEKTFPVLDDAVGEKMQAEIIAAKVEGNSVGGIIEVMVKHVPVGIGAPYFDSVESRLSHALFSVPAVKAIEFGDGFEISKLRGSEANDEMYFEKNTVKAYSNHNGGITGGITNGMPIVFRVAIKPTPSIYKEQKTVSLKQNINTTLLIQGRHDPCIVQRAVPVIEAVTAWVLWDLILEIGKWEG